MDERHPKQVMTPVAPTIPLITRPGIVLKFLRPLSQLSPVSCDISQNLGRSRAYSELEWFVATIVA
jgi:hypothetical protein